MVPPKATAWEMYDDGIGKKNGIQILVSTATFTPLCLYKIKVLPFGDGCVSLSSPCSDLVTVPFLIFLYSHTSNKKQIYISYSRFFMPYLSHCNLTSVSTILMNTFFQSPLFIFFLFIYLLFSTPLFPSLLLNPLDFRLFWATGQHLSRHKPPSFISQL